MNNTERAFIQVLQSFLTGDCAKLNTESINKSQFYQLARRQSVAGIVAYTLNRCGELENEEIMQKLTEDYEKTLSLMLRRQIAAENLSRKLSRKEIEHIVFKGPTVSRFYPVPELRAFGDVDIIVDKKYRSAVVEMMTLSGFEHHVADEGVIDCFTRGVECYEIHSALNVPKKSDILFRNFRDHIEKDDDFSMRFEHNFHLCYLIAHMEKHMHSGGAGIKMYLDIALYIRNCHELDLTKVREWLSLCGLEKFFDTVLWLCHKWFEVEIPSFITPMDETLYEQMCAFTLRGGAFGDHSKEGVMESAAVRQISSGKKGGRVRLVLKKAFPRKSELWRVYPQYADKNLLVPVAWGAHVVSVFTKNKFGRIKDVAQVDMEKVKETGDLLQKIGCI